MARKFCRLNSRRIVGRRSYYHRFFAKIYRVGEAAREISRPRLRKLVAHLIEIRKFNDKLRTVDATRCPIIGFLPRKSIVTLSSKGKFIFRYEWALLVIREAFVYFVGLARSSNVDLRLLMFARIIHFDLLISHLLSNKIESYDVA